MSGKIIEVRNLSRSYGRNKAVDNVSFSVEEGSVHGFLGPNGAGKTTVIKMLLGLIMPDCGEVEIFGLDFFSRRNEILKRVGAVVEAPAFFEYLTAFENLKFLSKFSGGCAEERILEALSIVGLSDVKDKCVGTFSYGMKQRLGIAQTLPPRQQACISGRAHERPGPARHRWSPQAHKKTFSGERRHSLPLEPSAWRGGAGLRQGVNNRPWKDHLRIRCPGAAPGGGKD